MTKYENDQTLDQLKALLNRQESEILSPWATRNAMGTRRVADERLQAGYRQAFSVDADRILHSLAYARYIDKTQVFYLVKNDHITHRVLHVQLVSKIARTIGAGLFPVIVVADDDPCVGHRRAGIVVNDADHVGWRDAHLENYPGKDRRHRQGIRRGIFSLKRHTSKQLFL